MTMCLISCAVGSDKEDSMVNCKSLSLCFKEGEYTQVTLEQGRKEYIRKSHGKGTENWP